MSPTAVHRFWAGPEPHPLAEFTANAICSTMTRPMEWTPEAAHRELTRFLGNPEAATAVMEDPDVRHVSNVVRYVLLWLHGGLWLDHDVLPLADLRIGRQPWTAGWTTPLGNQREGCALWFPRTADPYLPDIIIAATEGPSADEAASTRRSGAKLLTDMAPTLGKWGIQPRVVPFDRQGHLIDRRPPLAIHLWDSSHR